MLKGTIAAIGMSLAALTAAPHAADAAFDKKVALVIGNAAYLNAPALGNPVTDAKAIAAAFERLGFETVTGYDLDRNGMENTIREFARASRKADLTAFFYAGHGIAFDDKNYIIPVDARFSDATALDFEAVGMDFVVKQMRYNDGVSLVFIDACRDNPLASTLTRSLGSATRSAVSRGLADMDVKNAGRGLAIAFATSPGEVAYDGSETHSPFTSALLNNIELSGVDITEVMSRVTGEVLRITDERQRPWLNASLTGPVVLKPAPAIAAVAPAVDGAASDAAKAKIASLEADTTLFNVAYEQKSVASYESYLATFPNGLYAAVARQEIARLQAAQAPIELAALSPTAETVSDAADATPTDEADVSIAAAAVAEGTEETEASLALDRDARRDIQHRLNIAEFGVGYADGLFGPMTRKGIAGWQEEAGFASTGYLNAEQIAALEDATAGSFDAYVAEQNRIAAAAAERRAAAAAANAAAERAERAAATAAAKTRSVQAQKTRSAKKATPRRTTTAKAQPAQQQPRQEVVVERTYRMGRHTYEVRRDPNRGNAAAALFVGGVVGGIIGGAISR